jgi:alpha-L-fucosidase
VIIAELVDVVSKNGVLLLNIGRKPDGNIAEPEQELLRRIGRWLGVKNGQAIFGTPAVGGRSGGSEQRSGYFTDSSSTTYTGADIRFTYRNGIEGEFIYATALEWPDHGELLVTSRGRTAALFTGRIEKVDVLGYPGDVEWSLDQDGLRVHLPQEHPSDFGVTVCAQVAPEQPALRQAGFYL